MTDKVLEKCPKCSSTVTNRVECENCGIVFEKYLQAEARRKADAGKLTMEDHRPRGFGIVVFAALVLVLVIGYFVVRSYNSTCPIRVDNPTAAGKSLGFGDHPKQSPSVVETRPFDRKLLNQEPIQRALKGTVSIQTPWGSIGSGFFVGEHEVITNKHVITFDDTNFETLKNTVERNRKIIDLELQKINEWKKRMAEMPEGPNRSQLELIIQGQEEKVNKYLSMQRNDEDKFAKIKEQKDSRNIKIVMEDGKEYMASTIIPSPTHDLALLKVYSISGQVLKRNAQGQNLEQGQVVYAIGSPMGLSSTVTSGVFSSYRKMTGSGETYLQTYAAINPGNSGGPLIDNNGNVLGVNTMILTNTEGIGFAIPIDVVFEDFSGSL